MKTRSRLGLQTVLVSLLAAEAATGPVTVRPAEAASFNVTALRTERVDLYECAAEKKKIGQLARATFTGALPAATVDGSSLYIQVNVNGGQYCVKAFAVQTDKEITAPKDVECGTILAGRQEKTSSTRGIGEGCKR